MERTPLPSRASYTLSLAVAVVFGLLLASCGSLVQSPSEIVTVEPSRSAIDLAELASETCTVLESSTPVQPGVILTDAITLAAKLGFSGDELGRAMRTECPSVVPDSPLLGGDS